MPTSALACHLLLVVISSPHLHAGTARIKGRGGAGSTSIVTWTTSRWPSRSTWQPSATSVPAEMRLDEPFAQIDALTRGVTQEELVRMWSATQHTVFMVTHGVDEAIL